jgi:hypothetical protein
MTELPNGRECKIVCRWDARRLGMTLGWWEYHRFRWLYVGKMTGTYAACMLLAFGPPALVYAALLCCFPTIDSAANAVLAFCAAVPGIIAILAMSPVYGAGQHPTAIRLGPDGFKLEWDEQNVSPLYPWSAVSKATFDAKSYYWLDSQSVYLSLRKTHLDLRALCNFFFACGPLWARIPWGRTIDFRFRLETIPCDRDRQQLINAIRQHISSDVCEGRFLQISGGITAPSHTDIWLEKMSEHMNVEVLEPGAKLAGDSYVIEDKIASGGQGTVYLAHATELCEAASLQPQEKVVIKEFILPLDGGFAARQRALKHVQAEAELLTKLNHQKIIRMHDWFVTDRRAFLVLEHIDGKSLRATVEEHGTMPPERVRELALQMCDIVEYLHSLEPPVVHRDFTPENLMLTPEGALKLIDFNVAQQLEGNAGRTVVGKHAYIPPEQFKGRASRESDIYAMGATLFYLLTGEDPEPISTSRPASVNPAVPAGLDGLVAALTEPNLSNRLGNVEQIRAALINCVHADERENGASACTTIVSE